MKRQPRFEIVRTNAEQPWHARFRAANGRIVFTTEQYVRKEGARGALTALFNLCDCAFSGHESRVIEVDERYAPPPVVLVPPFYVTNPPHYERRGRTVTVTHDDFWHDHEYHWRQCSGDDCREDSPPVGTEVRSRMGSARYTP